METNYLKNSKNSVLCELTSHIMKIKKETLDIIGEILNRETGVTKKHFVKVGLLFMMLMSFTFTFGQSFLLPPSKDFSPNSKRAVVIVSNNDNRGGNENEYIYFRSGEEDNEEWYFDAQFIVADDWVGVRRPLRFYTKKNSWAGAGEYISNSYNAGPNRDNGLSFFVDVKELMTLTKDKGLEIRSSKGISTRSGTHSDWGNLKLIADNDNTSSTEDIIFGFDGDATSYIEKMRLTDEGNLGIGVNNPTEKLHVAGNIAANGGIIATGTIVTSGIIVAVDLLASGNIITGGNIHSNNNITSDGSASFSSLTVNSGGTNDLSQTSINTNFKVDFAALTVGGPTYIGRRSRLTTNGVADRFNANHLDEFNLWVEDGIITERFSVSRVRDGVWSDYVFKSDYILPSLEEVDKYIAEHGHLKDIPSDKDVEQNGYSLVDMDASFLQKIEELMLYTIEQQKNMVQQQKQIDQLKKEITALKELNN